MSRKTYFFGTGGEEMAAVSNAASLAAAEAATGSWFQELQSGKLPKVLAPGMPYGVFGPWQSQGIKALPLHRSSLDMMC